MYKDSVYLCILREYGEKIERVFGILTPQFDSMRDFMAGNKVSKVAMESTSVYWIPIWRVPVDSFELKLVNCVLCSNAIEYYTQVPLSTMSLFLILLDTFR